MKRLPTITTTVKVLAIAPITTAVLLTSASMAAQTQAMELRISETGRISIYENQVLGDTTDAVNTKPVNAARTTQETRPTREIPARANQNIEFRRNGDAVQVDVVQEMPTSVSMPSGDETQRAQERQRFEANRLQTTMPAARKNIESIPTTPDSMPEEAKMQPMRSEQVLKVLEERSIRTDETVELYKAGQNGESEAAQAIREMRIRDGVESPQEADFELRSRDILARIRNSAVTFNPESNSISIVTPSGVTKELNHLPDQAIERFKEFALIADKSTLELVPTETGEIYYRTLSERPVRVFGLFPRRLQTELLLNDETGEVIERRVGRETMLIRFLNAFSF